MRGSLLRRTKHKNHRTHWGTERFMITSYLKVFKGQIHWQRDGNHILNPQKRKNEPQTSVSSNHFESIFEMIVGPML